MHAELPEETPGQDPGLGAALTAWPSETSSSKPLKSSPDRRGFPSVSKTVFSPLLPPVLQCLQMMQHTVLAAAQFKPSEYSGNSPLSFKGL